MAIGTSVINLRIAERLRLLESRLDNFILQSGMQMATAKGSISTNLHNNDVELLRALIPKYKKAGWYDIIIDTNNNAVIFHYDLSNQTQNELAELTAETAQVESRKISITEEAHSG